MGYDNEGKLLTVNVKDTVTSAVLHQYAYLYDAAGNRTSEQIDSSVVGSSYNNLNQLTGQSGGGKMVFVGTLSEPAVVTVAGSPATSGYYSTNFTGIAPVTTGTNAVPVVAHDVNGNTGTNNYQVVIAPATGSYSYDLNGNLLTDGARTFQWDAKNQMTAIIYNTGANAGNHTEFTYNGAGERVKIVEATGTTVGSGTVTSTKQFVWAGGLAEEHDGSNTVTKRFFSQGEQIAGTNYYYTSDHLGSVREMMAGDGKTIAARYSYDPYGRATKVSGSLSCDFQYAGMYAHATSGLNLTKYRAYGPNVGRWISRDPLGEAVGLNLYAYCGDNPVCHTDPSGLCVMDDHPPTAGDPSGPLDPNGNIPNPVPPNTDHPPTSLDPSGPLNANGNSPGAVPPGYANSESGTAGLDTDGAGRSAVGETSHDPSTSAGPHVNGDITPYSAQNQNNGGAIRIPSAPQLILLTIILGLGQPVQYKTMLPSIIITREQSKYLLHWGRLSA